MAGVRMGEDSILGAMSVATRDVEDHSIAGGVPAKQLKMKDEAKQFEDRSDVKAPEQVRTQCD
jgi:acetyltransferase-like isoleucine patch superfamily enzyme